MHQNLGVGISSRIEFYLLLVLLLKRHFILSEHVKLLDIDAYLCILFLYKPVD